MFHSQNVFSMFWLKPCAQNDGWSVPRHLESVSSVWATCAGLSVFGMGFGERTNAGSTVTTTVFLLEAY